MLAGEGQRKKTFKSIKKKKKDLTSKILHVKIFKSHLLKTFLRVSAHRADECMDRSTELAPQQEPLYEPPFMHYLASRVH